MKFYQRRWFALIVLVLAVIGSCVWGMMKKPVELPNVQYYNWISDDAGLLSAETEQTIERYNENWNDRYYAVVAVAAVDSIRGWSVEDFTYALGEKWGLGANDMLLLVVRGSDYYVGLGDGVNDVMTDTQQTKLQSAIEPNYYKGDYNAAAVSFFRQADVFYAQAMQSQSGTGYGSEWYGDNSSAGVGSSLMGAIVVIMLIMVIWMMADRVRYNSYRRRAVVTPGIVYQPVFWGRSAYRRTSAPRPPYGGGHGGYAPPPPRPAQSRPAQSRPSASRPASRPVSRPSSGSRPSSSGSSAGRSSGGSRGGFGRNGFGGGRRR